jgi:hypothetical protein
MASKKNDIYGAHNVSLGGSSGGRPVNMSKQSIEIRSSNGNMTSIMKASANQGDSFNLLRS